MATCSISGNVAEEPVVTKDGHVFEKRLIVKHLAQFGTCPVTKEDLKPEDLIPLKVNAAVRPRPPTATSIPALLSLLQNEWDSLMLETHTIKQHVETLRQELAHALYKHDAACRVIARLIKERDAARAALANTQANISAAIKGTAVPAKMEVETAGINEEIVQALTNTAKNLSKNRKKANREAAARVAPASKVEGYEVKASHPLHSASVPGIYALDLSPSDYNIAVTGGADGNAIVFNHSTGKIVDTLKAHKKRVNDVKFHPTRPLIFTAGQDNTVCLFNQGDGGKYSLATTIAEHKAEVVGVTVHPSGDYFVTASADKSWAFYDLNAPAAARQIVADDKFEGGFTRVEFHPDGLILGGATSDSLVRIFDVKNQKNVATFKGHNAAVTAIAFSENGYYLASADEGGAVKLWDLRKLSNFHTIQSSSQPTVSALQFDLSGTYLAAAGAGLRVFSPKWEVVTTFSDHSDEVTAVRFGPDASFIASVSKDRSLKIYQ